MDKVHVHFAKDHASGQCGENVFWTLDSETGNLTISGEGKMYNYSFDGSPFFDKTSIKSVIIESGVTSIGDYAFFVCSSLTSIVIPNSVTSIGDYAFSYCGSLTSIVIPDSVTSIGSSAFTNCKSLTNVKLGSRVSFIGVNGFAECESIRSISLPDSIVSIGNKVFSGCVRLNDVYYSDCQKWKDVNVGTGNANLTEVNFHFTTHHYNDVGEATPPTCTQKGYTTYTCSVCNDTYVDNYVNAKGHTLGECVVTQEPSGTKPGVKTYYCSVCGDYVASELFYNDEDKPQTKPIVKGVSVSDLSVDYLEPTTINPTITADEGASYTVSYTSSNPSVATVDDNGKVTSVKQSGLNRGSTVITCKVTDSYGNTATDTCTVTVQFAWWQWLLKIVLFGWLWY